MQSAGAERLALWREGFGWWDAEPYREISQAVDANGVWRQTERSVARLERKPVQTVLENDAGEDNWHRERKIRNEKFAAATGKLPPSYYARVAKERRVHGHMCRGQEAPPFKALAVTLAGYVPLHAFSGYAFGRSVMLAEEIANHAAERGCPAAAIADPHSLVGCMEFDKACRRNGIKPLIGASIELPEGGELVLIARSKLGYINLSRLVTACHLGEPRLYPLGSWERLEKHSEGLLCLTGGATGPLEPLLIGGDWSGAQQMVERLKTIYGQGNVFIEIERSYLPWTIRANHLLLELAEATQTLPVAGGSITHARPEHFPAQDMVACIETLATVEQAIGRKPLRDPSQPQLKPKPMRSLNAERFFRSASEMSRLFDDRPDLLANTLRVADMVEDSVLPGLMDLPPLFEDDNHALREIVEANAYAAYPQVTAKHKARLKHEVDRIIKLGFATHFLIASEACRWAGEQGIHFSGRGSVVDSAVAFVLGISRIDAITHNLFFDRFLPADGSKRSDIDIDFDARHRDEVRGYLIRRFGVERTAVVAAIPSYNTRGIVREVGKALGVPEETLGFLAKRIHGGVAPDKLADALSQRPELRDSPIGKERLGWILKLADLLMDVPHGIGCHSSGLCISATPICDVVPVMWSGSPVAQNSECNEPHLRIMQWDKRSAKRCFDKFDLLCLRGHDVLSRTEQQVRKSRPEFNAQRIALDNPESFRAMRSGELIGIPQSASPAMRQAHVRLRTNNLHEASLVQAGIRPGVGGAVKLNELIARRRGKPYSFPHPDFEPILGLTYGIIVFQEQVDQLLQTFCGFTSGEAEDVRDAIHKRRREDFGVLIKAQLIEKCLANGYGVATADAVYDYVAGFKGYGFAQGHALSFAEISLRCVHLMQTEPAPYFAALLSSQPAGYYGPCTIANEARQRGVVMLPPSVNRSGLEFAVEDIEDDGLRVPNAGIRVGLMQLSGVSSAVKEQILAAQPLPTAVKELQPLRSVAPRSGAVATAVGFPREQSQEAQAFSSLFDFVRQVEVNRDELELLILSGALDELAPNRRAMLWAIPEAMDYAKSMQASGLNQRLPLEMAEPRMPLHVEDFDREERAAYERSIMGMDVVQHLMAFERERVRTKAITADEARRLKPGTKAVVVGNPIRLRFPPTSSGKRVVFFDLEDETALLNVTCFDDTYRRDGAAIVTAAYATVIGESQDRDGHTAFLAKRVFAYRPQMLRDRHRSLPVKGADFLVG